MLQQCTTDSVPWIAKGDTGTPFGGGSTVLRFAADGRIAGAVGFA